MQGEKYYFCIEGSMQGGIEINIEVVAKGGRVGKPDGMRSTGARWGRGLGAGSDGGNR